jgi:hypothetical protein
VKQRFTLDRESFEQFLAAVSLFQSLQQTAANRSTENSPRLLQYSLETLRAVDSGTLDLQSAFERVAGLALQIVGGVGAVVWLFTNESLVCRASVGSHFDDDHVRTALRLRLQSAGAFGTNPPSTLDLTRTLANYSGALGSALAVALLPGDKIAGAVAVFSDASRTFTERNYANLRLLAGFAQYVLTKWIAGQEQESLDDSIDIARGRNHLLPTPARSSIDRSARAPFISPPPSSRPLPEPIPDLYVPGIGTRVALADSNQVTETGADSKRLSTSAVREGPNRNSTWDNLLARFARKSSPAKLGPFAKESISEEIRTAASESSAEAVTPVARKSTSREGRPAASDLIPEEIGPATIEFSPAQVRPVARDFSAGGVSPISRESSPEGAIQNSPALHRWENWKTRFKSRRDDWSPAVLVTSQFVRRLKTATEGIFRNDLSFRLNWRLVKQAIPALVILAVMSFFAGLLTGGHQPLGVGSLSPVAEASAEPVKHDFGTKTTAPILAARKSPVASGETSHLRITDRETAATIADLSRYEVRNLSRAADYGDDEAALELGMLYELGRGFPQDCKKAAAWVTKAAENGNMAAEYNLGLRYRDGDGVNPDIQQAESWLRKAAAHKNSNAKRILAELSSSGTPTQAQPPR